MQTSIVLNDRVSLTPKLMESIGLRPGDSMRLTATGGQLLVEAAREGILMRRPSLWLSTQLMSSLGWQNGDVVGIETDGDRLLVGPVEDPMDPSLTSIGDDGAPVPPHWLVQIVIGNAHRDGFLKSGHELARFFADLIREYLPEVKRPAVMDFGCGCGRVARAIPQYLACEISGCDIIPAAIEWCQQYLPGTYLMSAENPPLSLDDGCVDVLYAVSVLTHLDEPHQDAWLAEWQRLVKPGGLLLVTYRGEGFLGSRNPPHWGQIERQWESRGFGFIDTDHWRGVFPKYYGGAYHSHAYVRGHWERFFDVIAEQWPTAEKSLVQDLALLRRR
jgi:SAM-dependent methyltransferase/antitoxin component of MazEF toxin-antitoxin module